MSKDNKRNRRNVLKMLGLSTSTAAVGLPALSGTATAEEATIDDPDWEDYEEWAKEDLSGTSSSSTQVGTEGIVYPSDVTIPNPRELGFDLCADWYDGTDYHYLCFSTFEVLERSYYNCAGRYITTVGLNVDKTVYDYKGQLKAEWGVKYWVGVDDYDCFHAGVSTAGMEGCIILDCTWDPTSFSTLFSTRQEVTAIAEEAAEWLHDHVGDPFPPPGTWEFFIFVIIIAGAIYLVGGATAVAA